MIDIAVEHVSKFYRLPPTRDRGQRREPRMLGIVPRRRMFAALKDISFDVGRGEALGIIGPNGSGKTTLVKLLSRITTPSAGKITLSGRLSAVIEVGAGFHPDLTGRENVFLTGAILGMSRQEIARKISNIVEFSEIGEFIGVPVKKYSAGMFVRLGFSIAVHLDADILLFDEVLAVGDLAFQARCFERVEKLRRAGRTVVLVSHDLAAVERICNRALLIRSGELVASGDPRTVIENYQAMAYSTLSDRHQPARRRERITVKSLAFGGPAGGAVRTGDPLCCRLVYEASELLDDVVVSVSLNWPSGYLCTQLSSPEGLRLAPGRGAIEFHCPVLTMQRGLYSVDLMIERRGEVLDWAPRRSLLRVDLGTIALGDFYMEHSCLVRPATAE